GRASQNPPRGFADGTGVGSTLVNPAARTMLPESWRCQAKSSRPIPSAVGSDYAPTIGRSCVNLSPALFQPGSLQIADHPPELRPGPCPGVNRRRGPVADVELEVHVGVGRRRHVAIGLDPVAVRD